MYFANGSEGMWFDDECSTCPVDENICSINFVQTFYNYEQVNNETATAILSELVSENGCKMKKYLVELLKVRD